MRALLFSLLLLPAMASAACDWPLWQQFKQEYMSEDGRVIDHAHADHRSTSEGQAYALYFSLLAGDRQAFDRILRWTENNLARGSLARNLPAWLWGLRRDGRWTVLDSNTASDADLWLAYALLEAGRLWKDERHHELGMKILANIRSQESMPVPGFGWTVLPGKSGFQTESGQVRLNPSYWVLFHWRRFALEDPWWQQLVASTVKLLIAGAPKGLAPDWMDYQLGSGLVPENKGSYDAIRVYLWLGMLHAQEPERAQLWRHFAPMLEQVHRLGHVPERTLVLEGRVEGRGGAGFVAAMLPWSQQQGRALSVVPTAPSGYYDHVLLLFQQGWQGYYAPDPQGRLMSRRSCT